MHRPVWPSLEDPPGHVGPELHPGLLHEVDAVEVLGAVAVDAGVHHVAEEVGPDFLVEGDVGKGVLRPGEVAPRPPPDLQDDALAGLRQRFGPLLRQRRHAGLREDLLGADVAHTLLGEDASERVLRRGVQPVDDHRPVDGGDLPAG
jgi:hypothetical protein